MSKEYAKEIKALKVTKDWLVMWLFLWIITTLTHYDFGLPPYLMAALATVTFPVVDLVLAPVNRLIAGWVGSLRAKWTTKAKP